VSLVIPPGFAQALYIFGLLNDPQDMVCTVGVDMDALDSDPNVAAAEVSSWFTAGFPAAAINEAYTFKGTKLLIGQDGGPPVIGEAPTGYEGTAGQGSMTQNVAILVKKTTSLGGRSGRGRMYLPPFMVEEVEMTPQGTFGSGLLAAVQARVSDWFFAGTYVLLHDEESPTVTPTPITGFIVDDRVATQRRRLR
jgi:hypothetical protein